MFDISVFQHKLHYLREDYLCRLLLKNYHGVWMASFPRSGSSWIRRLLYEILISELPEVDRMHQTILDIHTGWNVLKAADTKFPIIKTHFSYRKNYKNVIYIIRNPVDVIYSYWRYTDIRSNQNIELNDFIQRECTTGGIYGRWDNHVESYLSSTLKNKEKLLFLFYEDFVADPVKNLLKILEFSGLSNSVQRDIKPIVEKYIDKLLRNSSLEIEGYQNKCKQVHLLQVGKGQEKMNSEQLKFIKESTLGNYASNFNYRF